MNPLDIQIPPKNWCFRYFCWSKYLLSRWPWMSRGSEHFFSDFWALVDGLRSQWSVFQRAKAPEIGGFCSLICLTDSNADDVCKTMYILFVECQHIYI